MKDMIVNSAFFGIILTVGIYYLCEILRGKLKHPLINSILISDIVIITILFFFKIDLKSYNVGGQYISFLLTPATVCLAIPLYEQIHNLRKNWIAITAGVISGMLSSAITILVLAICFKLNHQQYVTLLPKSITTAIGMGISEEHSGIVPITIAVIVITGIIGNVLGEIILKKFKISHPIAKGVAYGSSAHALGTAKAMELGDLEGAISSLSLAVSGILTVGVVSIFVNFL